VKIDDIFPMDNPKQYIQSRKFNILLYMVMDTLTFNTVTTRRRACLTYSTAVVSCPRTQTCQLQLPTHVYVRLSVCLSVRQASYWSEADISPCLAPAGSALFVQVSSVQSTAVPLAAIPARTPWHAWSRPGCDEMWNVHHDAKWHDRLATTYRCWPWKHMETSYNRPVRISTTLPASGSLRRRSSTVYSPTLESIYITLWLGSDTRVCQQQNINNTKSTGTNTPSENLYLWSYRRPKIPL